MALDCIGRKISVSTTMAFDTVFVETTLGQSANYAPVSAVFQFRKQIFDAAGRLDVNLQASIINYETAHVIGLNPTQKVETTYTQDDSTVFVGLSFGNLSNLFTSSQFVFAYQTFQNLFTQFSNLYYGYRPLPYLYASNYISTHLWVYPHDPTSGYGLYTGTAPAPVIPPNTQVAIGLSAGACIASQTDYNNITGEVSYFAALLLAYQQSHQPPGPPPPHT